MFSPHGKILAQFFSTHVRKLQQNRFCDQVCKLWQNWFHNKKAQNVATFFHQIHVRCRGFQISPHMSCGHIWNFSTRGDILNFPTNVIHGKLKFLHMKFFSPQIYSWYSRQISGLSWNWPTMLDSRKVLCQPNAHMYSPSYIFLELIQEWFADWHYTISNLKHTLGWVAMRINWAHWISN